MYSSNNQKQNINININKLKEFINNLKKNANNGCPCQYETIKDKPTSKAQTVQICDNNVIKSSQNKIKSIRIEKKNEHTIKIDNITLNLLIQSITKKYVNNKKINTLRIEHYNKLCKESNQIKLVSKRASYTGMNAQKNNIFPTLEDYILKSEDNINNKIIVIKDCLIQSFEILDKLFDEIQFHHCDPKCAQLFLFNNSNSKENSPVCMLADLDKVTFTIKINENPYRICLTKDKGINTIKGRFISIAEKFSFLDKITAMRYENIVRKSNLLEKITFISSACILLGNNINESIELRDDMLKYILSKYNVDITQLDFNKIINLNDYHSVRLKLSRNRVTSLSTPLKYVGYTYLYDNIKEYLESDTKLHSIICLEPSIDSNTKYILDFCKNNNIK